MTLNSLTGRTFYVLLFFLYAVQGNTQQKIEISKPASSTVDHQKGYLNNNAQLLIQENARAVPSTEYKTLGEFNGAVVKYNLRPFYDQKTGRVIAVQGVIPELKKLKSHAERCTAYLEKLKSVFHLKDVTEEIQPLATQMDDKGRLHTKLDQHFKGIKVHGGELVIHEDELGNIYMVQGRTEIINDNLSVTPKLTESDIRKKVKEEASNFQIRNEKLEALSSKRQITTSLVIYKKDGKDYLAYEVDVFPNLATRETWIIDGHNGKVLEKYGTLCKLHGHDHHDDHSHKKEELFLDGKTTGVGNDLSGVSQNINIYQCSDEFFMVDASRTMFRGRETSCANSDELLNGVIITLDAGNTSPSLSNFDYEIATSLRVNPWNNPTAVSAHINGGRAYEYFKTTFGRESITGAGSNIVSFINVSEDDGSSMDNAFWNGEWIFYGNGNQAFTAPLAKALDVAGHEMSHGVIQSEANLVYKGEPGALNEHFADVFGVLIEREDFRIGEDIVNPSIFRTGTLRSMSDPNNGGRRVGDPGFQPATVSEQYRGAEDNGGVHLNSGIVNLAFYTFVTDESFGTDLDDRAGIGERIWYKVLTQYLRSTSNFSDMRVAVIQAAQEDFGSTVAAAAAAAFDRVGISGTDVTPEVEDLEINPGEEFVVWSDENLSSLRLSNSQGATLGSISNTNHISRPSATDNGRFVIFVNSEKQIQAVEIDQSSGSVVREFIVGEERIWRNAVISRDGSKIAAITGDLTQGEFDNEVFVFDLASSTSRVFELTNPTYSEGTTETGGVQYADVLEFDHSGENLVYDAFNQLSGSFGQDLSYWDIGILNVWSNARNTYESGDIFKLFSGLPKNVSIGNPTFSKNSPNIIAFDLRETDPVSDEETYQIIGLDRETGDVQLIRENNTFGFPSYSIKDENMIFNFINGGAEIIAITGLGSDKISTVGDAFVFTENAFWGIYIGTGERDLTTSTNDVALESSVNFYPNPVRDVLYFNDVTSIEDGMIYIYNIQGQLVSQPVTNNRNQLDVSSLNSGVYFLEVRNRDAFIKTKFVKY